MWEETAELIERMRKPMSELIRRTKKANLVESEMRSRMKTLNLTEEKENAIHHEQMSNFCRRLEILNKNIEFLRLKNRPMMKKGMQLKWLEKREKLASERNGLILSELEDKVRKHEAILQIMNVDTKDLKWKDQLAEDRNLSLLQYVMYKRQLCLLLKHEISELKEKLTKISHEQMERNTLSSLESETFRKHLESLAQNNSQKRQRKIELNSRTDFLITCVRNMFRLLEMKPAAPAEDILEENIIEHMIILEDMVHKLITIFKKHQPESHSKEDDQEKQTKVTSSSSIMLVAVKKPYLLRAENAPCISFSFTKIDLRMKGKFLK
ncbi:hypothetical protein Ciccas_003604 [Cichlidogyrus casuarinus]|uniref:ODAD1 central coiled coil region domain-containing protein n=1 Tax=Cichlidogyrus casuarinus TaxID=1844966 RepID=A0ABD2QG65_9PLAT